MTRARLALLLSLVIMAGTVGAALFEWQSLSIDELLGFGQIAIMFGIFAFVAYRARMNPWSHTTEAVLNGAPDRLEVEEREVLVQELRQPGTTPNVIVYSVQLPVHMRPLSLIDHGGRSQMSELHLGLPMSPELAPPTDTADPSFDGDFDFTEEAVSLEARELVRNPRIRKTLVDVRNTFGSLWIERGVLRVSEEGPYFPDGGQAAAEQLVWACAELERLAGNEEFVFADEEVVLDLEQSVEPAVHEQSSD